MLSVADKNFMSMKVGGVEGLHQGIRFGLQNTLTARATAVYQWKISTGLALFSVACLSGNVGIIFLDDEV